jgi:hypothetical protein
VGFEKSLWYKEVQGEQLLVGAHVDDFAVCVTKFVTGVSSQNFVMFF